MSSPDLPDIETRLKAVIDYVQDCDRRVVRGEIMDLSGLDKNVIEICGAISTLAPADAKTLGDRMKNLVDKLDVLAASMRQQQEKMRAKA